MRVDSGLENVEFAEESGGDRKSEKREQEKRKNGGHPGLALGEAGKIIELKVLFARAAELRNDGERTDFHQRVGEQIEEHRGISGGRPRFRCL